MLLTSTTTGPLGGCSAAPDELESTHIVAGAVEIVPTVHGDVQRMHLGPAVRRARLGEVTWRAEAEVRTPAYLSIYPSRQVRRSQSAATDESTLTPRGGRTANTGLQAALRTDGEIQAMRSAKLRPSPQCQVISRQLQAERFKVGPLRRESKRSWYLRGQEKVAPHGRGR